MNKVCSADRRVHECGISELSRSVHPLLDRARAGDEFENAGYGGCGWWAITVRVRTRRGASLPPDSRSAATEYDWLGDGAYFFQDAPARALEWARQRFGADAAVVGAEIDLDGCMDFLDVRWQGEVRLAYTRYRATLEQAGRPLPLQTRGAHRLDRSVINYLVTLLEERGLHVTSVRAAFGEGEPVFADSALLDRSHVQIAVCDRRAILHTWRPL